MILCLIVPTVFILLMNIKDVRKMMLRAAALSMTSGDFVYIVPEFQGNARIDASVWQKNDRTDVVSNGHCKAVFFAGSFFRAFAKIRIRAGIIFALSHCG